MLSNFLTDGLVVVVVLGIMIFVHELGHFIAAKWFGVRVLTFSLGFGKRLFGIKNGQFSIGRHALTVSFGDVPDDRTDYRVSILPLGGYVKMAGEDPSKPLEGDPAEFLSKPRWQRFVIAVMGPAMNIAMALALLTGLYKFHFAKPAYLEPPARVGDVEADSPAARAGIMTGDTIVGFDGTQNPNWEDIGLKILTRAGEIVPVQVLRDGVRLDLTLTPKPGGPDEIGTAGWYPYIPALIASVDSSLPAGKAGLRAGDQIVGVNGRRILCFPRVADAIQKDGGKPVELAISRSGHEFRVQLQPVHADVGTEKVWRIGVTFHNEVVVRRLPWGEAIAAALETSARNSFVTFEALRKILTRRMSPRTLSGPIGIAQMSGEAYREGWPELLMLVSFISLQLGIFNLLPIPILDGGVVLLLLIEALIRRDLSLQVKERIVQVGLVVLLLLAVVVMYNDIMKTLRPY